MQLPLAIFLAPYGLFIAIFGIFSLIDIAHLVKYRPSGFTAFLLTFFYLAGSILLIYGTWYFLRETDWRELFTLFNPLDLQPSLEF